MWIDSVRIDGGVLDGFARQFSPELNVVIGGRGTGKSSLIELIRFCLGAQSYTDAGQQVAAEHALGVLGDGRVTITLTDGQRKIEVSRTAQDMEPEASDHFYEPYVFSQSEIETIGLHSQSRLRLVDAFLDVRRHPSSTSVAAKIRSATSEIRALLAEIDNIEEKTAALPKLEAELKSYKAQAAAQGQVHKEIDQFRLSLAEVTPLLASARVRSETIGRAADALGEWADRLEILLDRKPDIEPWPVQAGAQDELADLRKKERQAHTLLRNGLIELRAVVDELDAKKTSSTSQKVGLENRARDVRQKIEEKQKGASALDKKISDLTQQISVLLSLVDLKSERKKRAAQLSEQRNGLLEEQDQARQQRTQQREQITTALNKRLSPAVRISVSPYSQHREYLNALNAALRGSGLRYGELSERIVEIYSPQEIAIMAEDRDFEPLAEALDINIERALRLCDALREEGGTPLFTINVEDDVQIELMDGPDYKGIDFLSMGQRCTAVLPIILNHRERIIILDQPEDHLDNAFVVGTLVKAIVARSKSSQTIVATHNPNIPVLGDAAQVIHLDSDGNRCFARACGSVDSPKIVDAITTIMEGGREAFMKRADFYAKNADDAADR